MVLTKRPPFVVDAIHLAVGSVRHRRLQEGSECLLVLGVGTAVSVQRANLDGPEVGAIVSPFPRNVMPRLGTEVQTQRPEGQL